MIKVKTIEKINPETKNAPTMIRIIPQTGIKTLQNSYFLSNSSRIACSLAQFSETGSSPA